MRKHGRDPAVCDRARAALEGRLDFNARLLCARYGRGLDP